MKISDDLSWILLTKFYCSKTQKSLFTKISDVDRKSHFDFEISQNNFGDVLREAKKRTKNLLHDEKWDEKKFVE